MGKGSSKKQVTGYRYYFDILMGICRGPVDEIVQIKVADLNAWPTDADGDQPKSDITYLQQLFNPGASPPPGGFYSDAAVVNTNAQFSINKPNLFGGDKGEGGIIGNVTVMMGQNDQIIPTRIKESIADGTNNHTYSYSPSGGVGAGTDTSTGEDDGSVVEVYQDISEFRGLVTIWYSGQVCSNNPYPKAWKIRTQRALAGWDENGCWYPDKAIIQMQSGTVRAMNPAHIIFQCLTDNIWGRGLPRSEIDIPSFTYAANYLFNEGFGLSIKWSKEQEILDFIQQVVDHINAVVIVDRGTGLMQLRLIRDDYDASQLPIFTYSSGLLKVESGDAASASVTPNEVIVKWHDPIHDEDRQLRVQDNASIQSTGAYITDTKDYPGICDAVIASRCAQRDLRIYSCGLKKLTLTMDRRAWKMQPGHVMRIQAPDKGIADMTVRVITYDDGTYSEGSIKLEVTQDVFAMPYTSYALDASRDFIGPDSTNAAPPANQVAYEASYYDMQHGLTTSDRSEVTSDEGGVIVLAGRPSSNTLSGLVVAGVDGETSSVQGTATFAPVGVVGAAIGFYDTTLQLVSGTDLDQVEVGESAIIAGQEIVRVDAFDAKTGIVTIARGCADTIPMQFPAKTSIYFHDSTKSGNTAAYAVGEKVDVSLLSRTNRDILDPAAATTSSVTVTGRWTKPYPPGRVLIGGKYPLSATGFVVSGTLNLTWASRNKVVEADQLVDHTAASVTPPEDGTTYTVQIWDHKAGTKLREIAGITDLSWSYSDNDALANNDPIELDIKLFTVVNNVASGNVSLASMDVYSIYVIKLGEGAGGYGGAYGYFYGSPPT